MRVDYEELSQEEFYAFEGRLKDCLKQLENGDRRGLWRKLNELKAWVDFSWRDRYPDFDLEEELARREEGKE